MDILGCFVFFVVLILLIVAQTWFCGGLSVQLNDNMIEDSTGKQCHIMSKDDIY